MRFVCAAFLLVSLFTSPASGAIITHDLAEFAIFSDKAVDLQNRFIVGGLVGSNSDIEASNTELPGIRAGGSLTLQGTNRDVNGDIIVNLAADLGLGHDIFGDVHSSADVSFDDDEVSGPDNKRVVGTILAKGDVVLPTGSLVVENIETEGSVELKSNSTVEGDIFAGGDVLLQQAAEVGVSGALIGGNVTTNGLIDMRKSAVIYGDARANGDILMGQNALIEGDATSSGIIDDSASGATINGTSTSGAPLVPSITTNPDTFGLLTLPAAQVFSVGVGSISNGQAGTGIGDPLAPGEYGDLIGGSGFDVYLTAGTYTFNTIGTGNNTQLYLDLSSGQNIEILVQGDAFFGVGSNDPLDIFISSDGLSYLPMDDPGIDPALSHLVSIEAYGTFKEGINGMWFGDIYTPFEGIEAARLRMIGGAYAGGYIDNDPQNFGIRLQQGHPTYHDFIPVVP